MCGVSLSFSIQVQSQWDIYSELSPAGEINCLVTRDKGGLD